MNSKVPEISIKDYTYHLPDDKIALQPLSDRSASKMLVFQNGQIQDLLFKDLSHILPHNSFVVLNETKVINARLHLQKKTGGNIEIFCLNPDKSYKDISQALSQKSKVLWQCIIGGRKKWKDVKEAIFLPINEQLQLSATIAADTNNETTILFEWNDAQMSFAEILMLAGDIPLPPYIKRAISANDELRYQTVFAKNEGSVAAPTASLHLTESLLASLENNGSQIGKINLHVGAGTFMPVKDNDVNNHIMHEEWIEVTSSFIQQWLDYIHSNNKTYTTAVGTTACRTLESLYWIGVKLLSQSEIQWQDKALTQWEAYLLPQHYSLQEALEALIDYMLTNQLDQIQTKTQLLILPGYQFRSIDILITNFHQPESTLLLLVAAFTQNQYRSIYEHALRNDYRFLSYGDGSILFKQ